MVIIAKGAIMPVLAFVQGDSGRFDEIIFVLTTLQNHVAVHENLC